MTIFDKLINRFGGAFSQRSSGGCGMVSSLNGSEMETVSGCGKVVITLTEEEATEYVSLIEDLRIGQVSAREALEDVSLYRVQHELKRALSLLP